MAAKANERTIYAKDAGLTRAGFSTPEDAWLEQGRLREKYPEPSFRIRVRLRQRTGLYDVVVKRQTTVVVGGEG